MKTIANSRSVRGFSLLEVLVAIVILSVGLLALASLQLTLIRASNDTKAQTTAMSLAKEKIETLGSYEIMGGTVACYSPAATAVTGQDSCYRQINTQATGDNINGVGGINYTRTTAVTRYVYNASTGTFVTAGSNPITNVMLDAGVKLACSTCLPGKEFKRIAVTVRWTDAGGVSRNVQVEDVIPGLSPADSLAVSSVDELTTPRKPTVIITNPASEAGVIPIAIGDGSDTAATNPRPVIVSQGNSTETTEVRYDVYTYAALSGDAATAQSRVENAFIGCTCTYGSGTGTAFRPTYWNGFLFKAPTTVTNMPVSEQATGNSVVQSEKCTACCRDHHDPALQAAPLFDPRRTTHNHYLATNLNSVVSVSDGNSYNEACRMIRVDGVFRVAAEPYVDHYGQLATVGLATSTATTTIENAVPGEGAGSMSELYATFVTNYLSDRYVEATAYNTVLDPTLVTGYSDLQAPASATINQTSSPQYMHSRGLQVEHLHTDAIAAITSTKAACAGCTSTELQTAVFKRLFFTTVPATELATWTYETTPATRVTVTYLAGVGDLSATLDAPMPISGRANYSSGTAGQTTTTTSTFQRTSAGQAITQKVFPDSELTDNVLSDTQLFTIGSGSSGSFPGGETVSLTMAGGTGFAPVLLIAGGNVPQVKFGPSTAVDCLANVTTTATPWSCVTNTTFGLGGTIAFKLANYNRSASVAVQNSCTQQSNDANDTTLMPYRKEFDLDTVTSAGATVSGFSVANTDAITEETSFTIGPIANGATVATTFGNVTYLCPANWATYINNAGNEASPLPDNSGSDSVCNNGNPKTPQWDIASAFIACPNGMSPFNGN